MNKKYVLNYKNKKGEIVKDLVDAIKINDSDKVKLFDIYVFYEKLNAIIEKVITRRNYKIFKKMVEVQPNYSVNTLYCLLKDLNDDCVDIIEELNYIKTFCDFTIELFMIINYIKWKWKYLKMVFFFLKVTKLYYLSW